MKILSNRFTTLLTSCILGATLAVVSSLTVANAGLNSLDDPPAPICADGAFLWSQDIDADNRQWDEEVGLWANGGTTSYTIQKTLPEAFGSAVTLSITDAVAWDGYPGRPDSRPLQVNERWRVVFLKDDDIVATSKWTGGDLPSPSDDGDDGLDDTFISDFWQGPLDEKIDIPTGTDEIRLVHWGAPVPFGTGLDAVTNSVVPTSLCISGVGASLGDRVWFDDDRDGQQDCTEGSTPPDEILGNAGDSGDECNSGVPDIHVNLRGSDNANCSGSVWIKSTTTDEFGFYGFDGLEPGANYCVSWYFGNLPYACTTPNVDADVSDSDGFPGPFACFTETAIVLAPGEENLTVDLGLVRLPLTASLGDRVWEDENLDGVQNCVDGDPNVPGNPAADGIIGNAGDTGPECDAGIPNVPVSLLAGDCSTSLGQTVNTDAFGFYLFDNLDPGDYCVEFGTPADDFCDTTVGGELFELGTARRTAQYAGGTDVDSDAAIDTGLSGSVDLAGGETDRSIDAGFYCPAKIGDRVWFDDNNDGVQDVGEVNVPGVEVELYECTGGQAIIDDNKRIRTTFTGVETDGMNYMFGAEPNFDLLPGTYFVRFIKPDGSEFTTPDGTDDATNSDCRPPDGKAMCTTLGPRGINLKQDCGLIPPPDCGLGIDKQCFIEPEPPQDFDKCDGKLKEFTVAWNDDSTITDIMVVNGSSVSAPSVSKGDELTVYGPFSDNDVEITFTGGVNGQSVFHTSCSDDQFNSPDDCGNAAGNGKDDDSDYDDLWTLAGFVDNEGRVLDCSPDIGGTFANECTFTPTPLNCDTAGKPKDGGNVTFVYSAGGCGASNNSQDDDKTSCTGVIDPDEGVTVTLSDDAVANPSYVMPGQSFTVTGISESNTVFTLSNTGGTETNEIHTSCSQDLNGGDIFGSLTLVGINGQGGTDVTYRYEVTSKGVPLTGVTVTDDLLGDISQGPFNLGTYDSKEFFKTTSIIGTTVNIVTASAGPDCSASDSVTVTAVAPTCDVSIVLDKIEDKKIKWKLSNSNTSDATIETLSINWPGDEKLKKIKFDGNDILKDVKIESPAVITSDMWQKALKDRVLKAGDSGKKIEFEFTGNFPEKNKQLAGDFQLNINFEEGCSVDF